MTGKKTEKYSCKFREVVRHKRLNTHCHSINMQLLLLASFMALASANPALLGSNKCTYGPSYWCSHVKHARECGAMKHCMTAVWNFNTAPVKNDVGCETCVFGVTEVRNLLKKNMTEAQVAEILDNGCRIIPDSEMQQKCLDVVKNYLPEILQLLASDVDPKAICTAVGLCTTDLSDIKMVSKTTTTSSPPDICADCKKLVKDLEATLKSNATEGEIEQALDSVCEQLGPLADMCKQLVAQYVPIFLDTIKWEFNPAVVCRMIGLCQTDVKSALEFRLKLAKLVQQLPVMSNTVSGSEECNVCKMVMGELQTLDRDAKTQESIEKFLDTSFCSLFGQLETQCQELIKDYAPMVFEYLANELDPELACKTFHMCTQTSVKPMKKITSVSLGDSQTALNVRSYHAKSPVQSVKASSKSSAYCVLCEFVIQQLDSMLQENASEAEVAQALEKVCSLLPSTISAECKSFVDQYAPAVIALLVSDIDPQQVCTFLGLCSGRVSLPVTVNEGTCDVCKLIIQYVDTLLKQNATEQEIMELLEKLCNFLPGDLRQQCDSIIKEYGPAIAQLLAQFADPLKVCQSIGLCQNSTVAAHQGMKSLNHLLSKAEENNRLYFEKTEESGVNCLTGPSVWCRDAATANKCGVHAVDYCHRHVWSK